MTFDFSRVILYMVKNQGFPVQTLGEPHKTGSIKGNLSIKCVLLIPMINSGMLKTVEIDRKLLIMVKIFRANI